jgi:hypothetical protein
VLSSGKESFLMMRASCSLTLSALCIDRKLIKLAKHHSFC